MSISAGCAKRSSQIPADQSTSKRFVASAIGSRYQPGDETQRQGDKEIIDPLCLSVSVSLVSLSDYDLTQHHPRTGFPRHAGLGDLALAPSHGDRRASSTTARAVHADFS